VPNEPSRATSDPDHDGRFLIAIKSWDGNLHVGLSPEITPVEHRFQGGLMYVRSFYIEGEFLAPRSHRGRRVRIWISPFGPDLQFGSDGLECVGQLSAPDAERSDFGLTLLLPESGMAMAATSLASVWKYLHVWTFAEGQEVALVSDYSFDAELHQNLADWAAGAI
jgi:hypothetical protein